MWSLPARTETTLQELGHLVQVWQSMLVFWSVCHFPVSQSLPGATPLRAPLASKMRPKSCTLLPSTRTTFPIICLPRTAASISDAVSCLPLSILETSTIGRLEVGAVAQPVRAAARTAIAMNLFISDSFLMRRSAWVG